MTESSNCPRCGREFTGGEPEGLCPRCLMQAATERSPVRAAFETPTVASLADHFPGYELESLLGRGGMGAVYRARDKRLDRPVAIKILPQEVGADPEFAERFLREARVLGRLNHVNIVQVYDFGDADGLLFIVMALVESGNLRDAMRGGRMDPDEATRILREVADALVHAHAEGVVHRDIKPENVLVDKDGHARLADFGLVRLIVPDGLSATQQSIGTPYYMAPEQLTRPASVDARADIYSFGVLAYEMLTGELPVGQFPDASRTAGVPARFDDLIGRCLQRDPESRWDSMAQVRDALFDRKPAPAVVVSKTKAVSAPVVRDPDGLARPTLNRLALIGALGFLFCFAPWFTVQTKVRSPVRRIGEPTEFSMDATQSVTAVDTRFDLGLFDFPGWFYPILAGVFVALVLIHRGGRNNFPVRVYAILAGLFLFASVVTSYKVLSAKPVVKIEHASVAVSLGIGLFAELLIWVAMFIVLAKDGEATTQSVPAGASKALRRRRRAAGRKLREKRRNTPLKGPSPASESLDPENDAMHD